MRSVGVGGTGHSAWSVAAHVTMPGKHEEPAPASSCAEDSENGSLPKKRRNKKAAADRELTLADPKLSKSHAESNPHIFQRKLEKKLAVLL